MASGKIQVNVLATLLRSCLLGDCHGYKGCMCVLVQALDCTKPCGETHWVQKIIQVVS